MMFPPCQLEGIIDRQFLSSSELNFTLARMCLYGRRRPFTLLKAKMAPRERRNALRKPLPFAL
jgi:hypothetical protein